MTSLLNAVTFSWNSYFENVFEGNTEAINAAKSAVGIIETALWIIIGVVGLAAVIYAIYLGFNLARASEQGKRDEAKKHLITVIIAIVVTLVLVIFFLYLLPGILGAFHTTTDGLTGTGGTGNTGGTGGTGNTGGTGGAGNAGGN